MQLLKIVSALACLVMPVWAPLAAQAPNPAAAPISVQQASVADPGHAPIPVAIWAPANGTALPLIIISHGTGAGSISHIDTAQALAEAGFVVVAPMHPGDNFQDGSMVGRPGWFADRSRHVSQVIDFMFATWDGRARLVRDRVGIFGFSAGATTALISIGGVPDLRGVPAHCARAPEFVCSLMAPPGTRMGFGLPPLVHDYRIAAAVLAAPGLGFAFAPGGLANVRIPVQLWTGDADRTVPSETNANVVRQLLRGPVDFHRVPGAVHLSFLAPCGPESPPQICRDGEGFDRAAFHRELNRSMIEFFRRHLIDGARPRRP
ncbi:MAG TPA: dienelactone hydrolase [Allosphingosinicella sp.]|jgi:predicted dienelactone hydrolase|nr:dienelactone hydrolase [Allosphingosinicella sp.]